MARSSSADETADARQMLGKAKAALGHIKPFAELVKNEIVSTLCQASRNKDLTNDRLRSMVGELAGIERLIERIDSEAKQAELKVGQ